MAAGKEIVSQILKDKGLTPSDEELTEKTIELISIMLATGSGINRDMFRAYGMSFLIRLVCEAGLMKEYKRVSTANYNIERLDCMCRDCTHAFDDVLPSDYELVAFEELSDRKVFMPTYGEGGYLDLLKRLVPEWNEVEEISVSISEKFEKELNRYVPDKVKLCNGTVCPKCGGRNIEVLSRVTEANHPVEWMMIDASLLKQRESE